MSKQIILDHWVSQIPNKMFDSWVSRGFIHKDAREFTVTDTPKKYVDTLEHPKYKRKHTYNPFETLWLQLTGWRLVYHTWCLDENTIKIIHNEVKTWYNEVFAYTKLWLKAQGLYRNKVKSRDKVTCIKEKFGYITVYFQETTDEQKLKIKEFAKHLREEYDCATMFG